MNQIVSFKEKLENVKNTGQDFEWYPTKENMIRIIFADAQDNAPDKPNNLMDIGAGDGSVFTFWEKMIDETFPKNEHGYRPNMSEYCSKYFAIEKSAKLQQYLPNDVVIVGTDFTQSTLIDKNMDIIFSNPPYSEAVPWSSKIIMEANTTLIYLIIPERHVNHPDILKAIERRGAVMETIHKDNFMDAKRKARAEVAIVRVDLRGEVSTKFLPDKPDENATESEIRRYQDRLYRIKRNHRSKSCNDPFGHWFYDTFKKTADTTKDHTASGPATFKERLEVVPGQNLIERLANLYDEELDDICQTYNKLRQIDPALLERLGVGVNTLMEGVRAEIKGLKNLYWKELFDNLNKITDKLTAKSRKGLIDTLISNISVDFSVDNAYAIVMWAMKNANQYYDKQLIDAYESLISQESILRYKSNRHLPDDDFRFTHIYDWKKRESSREYYLNDGLDFRIVCAGEGGIYSSGSYWEDESRHAEGILEKTYDYLKDVCVIANNLGFEVISHELNTPWESGKLKTVYTKLAGEYKKGDKTILGKVEEVFPAQYRIKGEIYHKATVPKQEKLFTARAYKNKNLHFKFNQNFLKKWNVEFGRLKGWINNKEQASDEMEISMEEINEMYGCNFQLESSPKFLLEKVV